MATSFTVGPLADDAIRDPYAYYGRLRESDPVYWEDTIGSWFVTRYEDVVRILRNPAQFSSRTLTESVPAFPPIDPSDVSLREHVRASEAASFIRIDRPEHATMRRTVQQRFTPKEIERWRPVVRLLVEKLLDDLQQQGSMDIVGDLARPLPLAMITTMMGVPEADRPDVRAAIDRLLELRQADPHRFRRIEPAITWLETYLGQLLEERHRRPADDLLTLLVQAERNGVLSRERSLANGIFLLHAGQVTTVSLISNGMLAFLRHPDQWRHLAEDPAARIAPAVEEVLRYEPSVKAFDRMVTTDTLFERRELKAGQRVYCVISSANRDARRFGDPDRLDIDRSPNPHLTFGSGFHSCLGANLVRIEAQEIFSALAARFPSITLACTDSDLEYIPSLVHRQLRDLPVMWRQ